MGAKLDFHVARCKNSMYITTMSGLRFSMFTMIYKTVTGEKGTTPLKIFCYTTDGATRLLEFTEDAVVEVLVQNRYALRCADDIGSAEVDVVERGNANTLYRINFKVFLNNLKDYTKLNMSSYMTQVKQDITSKTDLKIYFEDQCVPKDVMPIVLTVDEVMGPTAIVKDGYDGKPFCKIFTKL